MSTVRILFLMVFFCQEALASTFTFSYLDSTDIKKAVEQVARDTGKILIVDQNVTGKFQKDANTLDSFL